MSSGTTGAGAGVFAAKLEELPGAAVVGGEVGDGTAAWPPVPLGGSPVAGRGALGAWGMPAGAAAGTEEGDDIGCADWLTGARGGASEACCRAGPAPSAGGVAGVFAPGFTVPASVPVTEAAAPRTAPSTRDGVDAIAPFAKPSAAAPTSERVTDRRTTPSAPRTCEIAECATFATDETVVAAGALGAAGVGVWGATTDCAVPVMAAVVELAAGATAAAVAGTVATTDATAPGRLVF
ncbi:MAG TPA: hypothetical protein VID68_10965 [Solirubrobacteraceae bacterium]